MALGDGTGWDEADPADSDYVSEGPVQDRDLRKGVRIRMAKEHVLPAASSVGGEHKAGSALVYVNTTAPTNRPDAATALSSADAGRVWHYNFEAKIRDASAWNYVQASMAVLHEGQSAGTQGGTLTAATWNQRVVTELSDPSGIVSVSGGAFTLGVGRYRIRGWAMAYKVDGHKVRLQNTTDATTDAIGSSALSPSSITDTGVNTMSCFEVELILTASKTFQLQHNCQTTKTANGKGEKTGISTEVYARVTIEKVL